ncbi:MAG: molybdenum ABC transporter ATP-binding protein [Candidatus Hydrogenedentota bacterium]|nr:MAG: molybdenum ABC transporter ATP-binding protein [Candidatus Hydrogenedentota bacterium]
MKMLSCACHIEKGNFLLDLNLQLPLSGIVGITGHSGSGKSTFLKFLAGFERDSGTITLPNIVWQNDKVFVPPHKRNVGFVFQQNALFSHLTVKKNIEYGFKRYKKQNPEKRVKITMDEVISVFQMENLLEKKPNQLSGGQQSKVALARALAANPTLLLCDEPLANLDDSSREEILNYLKQIPHQFQIPIYYVSHSLSELASISDVLLIMDNGKVLKIADAQDVLTDISLPLAQSMHACSFLQGTLIDYDDQFKLAKVQLKNQMLYVPAGLKQNRHKSTRVIVSAKEVALSKTPPATSRSILNSLEAVVEKYSHLPNGQTIVQLSVDSQLIIAKITTYSAEKMALQKGGKVFAEVKAVTLTL